MLCDLVNLVPDFDLAYAFSTIDVTWADVVSRCAYYVTFVGDPDSRTITQKGNDHVAKLKSTGLLAILTLRTYASEWNTEHDEESSDELCQALVSDWVLITSQVWLFANLNIDGPFLVPSSDATSKTAESDSETPARIAFEQEELHSIAEETLAMWGIAFEWVLHMSDEEIDGREEAKTLLKKVMRTPLVALLGSWSIKMDHSMRGKSSCRVYLLGLPRIEHDLNFLLGIIESLMSEILETMYAIKATDSVILAGCQIATVCNRFESRTQHLGSQLRLTTKRTSKITSPKVKAHPDGVPLNMALVPWDTIHEDAKKRFAALRRANNTTKVITCRNCGMGWTKLGIPARIQCSVACRREILVREAEDLQIGFVINQNMES